jgi:hypothetical protein
VPSGANADIDYAAVSISIYPATRSLTLNNDVFKLT